MAAPAETLGIFGRKRKSPALSAEYAEVEDYPFLPELHLRPWNYGHGLNPGSDGFGFSASDGRIWPAKNCSWSLWDRVHVLVLDVVVFEDNTAALQSPAFAPGQPLRVVLEPENDRDPNPVAFRSADLSLTAGFLPQGNTLRLRSLLGSDPFQVVSLSTRSEKDWRTRLQVALFPPGRVHGCEKLPVHPPI